MATSSIMKEFVMDTDEQVEKFLNAFEKQMKNPIEVPKVPNAKFLNGEEAQEFVRKLVKKHENR